MVFSQILYINSCSYRNDSKFSDRQVKTNSADPDQGLHCLISFASFEKIILFI